MTFSAERIAELIAEIEQAGEAYASFVQTLSEQQFRRRPAPSEWTAAEITGHVSEAPVTFATHARVLAEQGGGPAGRAPDDPGRLAAVGQHARNGPMSVRSMVESFILSHVRGHLRQAKEAAGVE
jgi:hypothetical protein